MKNEALLNINLKIGKNNIGIFGLKISIPNIKLNN